MTLNEVVDQIWKAKPQDKSEVAERLFEEHGDDLERMLINERIVLPEELSTQSDSEGDTRKKFFAARMVMLQFIRDHMDSKLLWAPEARENEISSFCSALGVTTDDFWALFKRWNKLDEE